MEVHYIVKKTSRALAFIKHAMHYESEDFLVDIYRGIIEPHFRYCCSVCGSSTTTKIDNLRRLQDRNVPIITQSL